MVMAIDKGHFSRVPFSLFIPKMITEIIVVVTVVAVAAAVATAINKSQQR